MKILYHSYEFGPGTGGIGQYLYQVAKGVRAAGHEVLVVCGPNAVLPAEGKDNKWHVYQDYEREQVRTERTTEKVLRLAEEYGVDLIEGTDHLGECARIISRSRRPRVLIKYHGCQFIKALTSAEVIYPWQRFVVAVALWKIRRQIKAEQCCVERPDAAIYPSEKIRADLQEQHAVLPHRLQLIPNMLSKLPVLSGKNEEAARPTMLFVGRIEIRKGIQYLPGLLQRLSREFPDVLLEIAGGDQYARGIGSLQKWLKTKLGPLADRVRFLGALGPEELDAAYRRSWLLVFPSKWDNFPMAVLEAMAYGKPVVTTANGGMPEMLAGTGAAIERPDSAAFADAVSRLLASAALRRQVGAACRERVMNTYMPAQVIPTYIDFIQSIL